VVRRKRRRHGEGVERRHHSNRAQGWKAPKPFPAACPLAASSQTPLFALRVYKRLVRYEPAPLIRR
jgi:hypothetical protein